MKIAISGASGYIGQHLTLFFTEKGDEVVPLGRNLFKEENFDELCHRVESCDVVINLAGASINKRWTKAYKQELYDSRIRTTHQLVNAINTRDILPKLFISTSAVGYYPTSGEYDEYNNRQGEDFLARLCGAWEKEARACLPDILISLLLRYTKRFTGKKMHRRELGYSVWDLTEMPTPSFSWMRHP